MAITHAAYGIAETMCILFVAWQMHPDYPLVIVANRDEYFARPTTALAPWSNTSHHTTLIAGKDLQAGGTWLGANVQGQFAALTNIRCPALIRADAKSRGAIVTRYLEEGKGFDEVFTAWLQRSYPDYNPFNLLWGDANALWVFNSVQAQIKPLGAGFHSISNGALDARWPKMLRGTQALRTYLEQHADLNPLALLALMQDETQAPTTQLPDTGIALEYEQVLSSIFIAPTHFPSGWYGTRSTTVVLQTLQKLSLWEQSYTVEGIGSSTAQYEILL